MGRPRFRVLPHTADLRLAVWGGTIEELAAHAVVGALRVALGRDAPSTPSRSLEVRDWPRDPSRLLVAAVNEALFLLYSRRQVVCAVVLRGRCATLGVSPLPGGFDPEVEVKAATFHELAPMRGAAGRLRAVLTLDL